ncbi:MAG: TIGR03000 domain-containing protein, partial [Gemmataceae bacterium]|nr:TIGR03000 domain-containing protein [Gemmataceae bacterium]
GPSFGGGYSCQGGLTYPPPMLDTFPTMPGQGPGPFAQPYPADPMYGFRPPAINPNSNSNTGAVAVAGGGARATVVVKLPTDARLFADGRQLNLTGAERRFVTPELPANQEFVYRFRIEYERDGETVSVTKRVPVQAGGTATVEFVDLTAARAPSSAPAVGKTTSAPAAPGVPLAPVNPNPTEPALKSTPVTPPSNPPQPDRATITVKLPPGATLYVDDRKSPSQDGVRQFATPPLPADREFAYTLKAEIVRDGRPESFTQKVPFRAGDRVTVDFTSLGK